VAAYQQDIASKHAMFSVVNSDHCVMYDRLYENDWRVFFGCEKLEAMWEAVGHWHIIKENMEVANRYVTFFFQLLEQLLHQ